MERRLVIEARLNGNRAAPVELVWPVVPPELEPYVRLKAEAIRRIIELPGANGSIEIVWRLKPRRTVHRRKRSEIAADADRAPSASAANAPVGPKLQERTPAAT